MTPDDAYDRLADLLDPTKAHMLAVRLDDLRTAWQALDAALTADAELPYPWSRIGATRAAERAGKPSSTAWSALVTKGYAPPPDGHDDAGRAWWHLATVDAYVEGTWKAVPKQRDPADCPPVSGTGADREAWATWAKANGVTVLPGDTRTVIQRSCRDAGLIR